MAAVHQLLDKLRPIAVPVSLYIHIPFCGSKCGYCDFYSLSGVDKRARFPVIRSIAAELRQLVHHLHPPSISSVFIGGGTPNCLSRQELEVLLTAVRELLSVYGRSPGFEWTLEANPEFITPGQLLLFEQQGVNRLSIGVQSFRQPVLRTLSRNAGPRELRNALRTVARDWHGALSLDMIVGIPGRSASEEGDDIAEALSWSPDHLSVYTLTIEEGTPLAALAESGKLPVSQEDEVAAALETARRLCTAAGFRHYEISNYAPPGRESLHNLRYWRMEPYLGVGPGAVSTLPAVKGPLRITAGRESGDYETETLKPEEFFLEHLMMGLRTAEGVSLSRLERIFGVDPLSIIPRSTAQYCRSGLLLQKKNRLQPSPRGMLLLNRLLGDMAMEIDEHSRIVRESQLSWPLPPQEDPLL